MRTCNILISVYFASHLYYHLHNQQCLGPLFFLKRLHRPYSNNKNTMFKASENSFTVFSLTYIYNYILFGPEAGYSNLIPILLSLTTFVVSPLALFALAPISAPTSIPALFAHTPVPSPFPAPHFLPLLLFLIFCP